ncbi:SecC domain-containing protein [Bacillus sp. 1NLA3E]|nr:SecC domain-containing protein [Bacillus sp. 1NLA3E]
MKQKNVVQINEVKEERFFQQKHELVLKIRSFIESKLSFNRYAQLQAEFSQRSEHTVPPDFEDGFFQFWLFFCHRYESGLRGIEWFFQSQEARLSPDEKTMAKRWTGLSLKLVEAVQKGDDYVVFEDVLTKDKFTVNDTSENIPEFLPWYSTIGLLEEFGDKYYFNGVRIFKGPTNLYQAVNRVQNLVETEKLSNEQILFDFYPEILSSFLTEQIGLVKEESKNREIPEYILEYEVLNESLLESFLLVERGFILDKDEAGKKIISWVGNWKQYRDNELEGEVLLAEVFGVISIEKDKLIFTSFDQQKTEELKSILKNVSLIVQFVSEKIKTITLPFNAIIKNSFAQMSKEVPPYFALYAQADLLSEIDITIPKYNHKSIRQLVESNQVVWADTWLKQNEYNLYQQVKQQFKKVEVTADFNTVRKLLKLPLSAFVKGGAERHTSVEQIGNPYSQNVIDKEDIPFYEDLGFTPSSIDNFYAKDLVAFFKEKTFGKGEGTVRKYRSSVYLIKEQFESQSLESWNECDESFWTKMIVEDLLEIEVVSNSFRKDFFSTIKALTKWIDSNKNMSISKSALKVINDTEDWLASGKLFQKA